MQVVDNSTTQYQHLLLQGYRVIDGDQSTGTNVEKVGALVFRQYVTPSGDVMNDEPVLTEDLFFEPVADPPQIRMESDLPVTKPGLDCIVVKRFVDQPDFETYPGAVPATPIANGTAVPFGTFGRVGIQRSATSTEIVEPIHYGWFPRIRQPRKGRGGDKDELKIFNPSENPALPPHNGDILPQDYEDRFQNGAMSNDFDHLQAGQTITFEARDINYFPIAGLPDYSATVPPAATLTVKLDGTPIEPQPDIEFGVDTACLDIFGASTDFKIYFTWRAVFVWDDAYELAELEIT